MTWPIILLFAAAALMLLEVMVPSFGMLGLLSATSYVFAVVLGFQSSTADGLVVAGAGLVVLPAAFLLGFRLMKRTRLGRRTLLEAPPAESIQRGFIDQKEALLGKHGTAITDLRPSGMAEIGGTRTDVVSSTAFIHKDTPIRVIGVEGPRIVVEQSDGRSEGRTPA